MSKQAECNLCGSTGCDVVYEGHDGEVVLADSEYRITDHTAQIAVRIVKCRDCGLMYAHPVPEIKDMVSAYANMEDPAYVEEAVGRRLSAQSILDVLKTLRKQGRLLDIGCATGFLLDEAQKAGWEVHGVELSRWASDYAKKTLGLKNIYNGVLKNAGFPDDYFDVVIMKDVIEHLSDPRSVLAEIRRILKPDGMVCVNTPDVDSLISRLLKARWWGIKQSHLYYFNRRTLVKMLEATGYAPVKFKSHVRVFTLKYWLDKCKGYSEFLHKALSFMARYRLVGNGLVRVNLGDQIEVYARKNPKR